MKRFFYQGGTLLQRVSWSKVPVVVAALAITIIPAFAFARGPIVSGSMDWISYLQSLIAVAF